MIDGKCVWFDAEQGFGVVVSDEVPGEVWVHFSDIEGSGYRELLEGEPVRFDYEEPRGGQDGYRFRATHVVRRGR